MKARLALWANAFFAAVAALVMTSASSVYLYRPEIPAELQRKQ
mgnify:CR=1 FL=1